MQSIAILLFIAAGLLIHFYYVLPKAQSKHDPYKLNDILLAAAENMAKEKAERNGVAVGVDEVERPILSEIKDVLTTSHAKHTTPKSQQKAHSLIKKMSDSDSDNAGDIKQKEVIE